jgi:hypothetical protein
VNKSSLRAALVLTGGVLVLAGSMLPALAAPAAAKGWRISTTIAVPGRAEIQTSADAVTAGDAWAIGFSATTKLNTIRSAIEHWNGSSWRQVTPSAAVAAAWAKDQPLLPVIAASSAKQVWAFSSLGAEGGQAHYLRLDGSRWSTGKMPGGKSDFVEITAAKAFGARNTWAYGFKTSIKTGAARPYAAHFNGKSWAAVTVPGKGQILAVASAPHGVIWALLGSQANGLSTTTAVPAIDRWTAASGWHVASLPAVPPAAQVTSIVAEPGGTLWVGGELPAGTASTKPWAAELAPAATAWSAATLPAGTGGTNWALSALAADGKGGLWALSTNEDTAGQPQRILHLQGAAWSIVKPGFGHHEWLLEQLAAIPGTDSVWGVGAQKHSASSDGLIAIEGPAPR